MELLVPDVLDLLFQTEILFLKVPQFGAVFLVVPSFGCAFDDGEGDVEQLEHVFDVIHLLLDLRPNVFFKFVVLLLLDLFHFVKLCNSACVFPPSLEIGLAKIAILFFAQLKQVYLVVLIELLD